MRYPESYGDVKTCYTCGKTALYHYGKFGACKRHVGVVKELATRSINRKLALTERKRRS